MLRFGVVGAGSIAREFSLRYLIPANGVEVIGIVDVNLDAARSLAEDVGYHRAGAVIIGAKYRETVDRNSITKSNDEIPQVFYSTNLSELLPLVDCIYVATPPSTHADLVAQVLSAQKQIILEKPLAVSLNDCDRIVNLSQEALGNGLFVGINIGMRYNAALHEMKRLINHPAFGQIENASLRLLFRQWPREWQRQPWVAQRQEGGPLLEVGTHWVFGILELFGHNHYHSTHSGVIEYPDGADGILCESRCSGMIEFQNDSQKIVIDVTIETTSDEAQSEGKDIYELIVKGSAGKTYVLYDFTRLREEEEQDGNRIKRDLVTNATYGRHEPKPCAHGHEKLVKHTGEFGTKEVIKVTEGVYVAIGYGLANSIMIEGDTGLIIVDCMESHHTADAVMTAFRRYSKKPVIALIYTHFHHDHVGGSYAYLKYTTANTCEVYAHELTASILAQFMGKTGSIGQIRAARQFGNYLPAEEFINSGIGPCLDFNPDCELSILPPSVTFSKELSLTLDGVSLRLVHCPGETDDQIVVHVVDRDVLCAADNIYRAFPNLYAIRGTPSRDAYVWANSLQVMASFNVTHLVPSHTQPVTGRDKVREVLEVYRDAVLFVHDQTVRYMNKGYFLDDIVSEVRLPPHLIDHPYLQEFYGTVEWSVRGVFTTYLGWFSGDPSHLHPYSPLEYSQRMIRLAGGVLKLLESAEIAYEENDAQWALHCTQVILRFTSSELFDLNEISDSTLVSRARQLMLASLRSLASREVSANGRNYYLTYAREVEGKLVVKPGPKQVHEVVKQLGAVEILKLLPLRLRSELCEEVTMKVAYRFPDIQRAVTILVSRGVAHVEEISYSSTSDLGNLLGVELLVTVDAAVFEGIAANERNKTGAILTGDMVVTGKGLSSSLALKSFMDYFEDSSMDFKAPL